MHSVSLSSLTIQFSAEEGFGGGGTCVEEEGSVRMEQDKDRSLLGAVGGTLSVKSPSD